ncbi:hypothetical protein AFLA_008854 [Aspergillus flavus NRRL3357]|nr:hypothetical protein AFLA_008854 [Aspergillus flavus NRRL3357]
MRSGREKGKKNVILDGLRETLTTLTDVKTGNRSAKSNMQRPLGEIGFSLLEPLAANQPLIDPCTSTHNIPDVRTRNSTELGPFPRTKTFYFACPLLSRVMSRLSLANS